MVIIKIRIGTRSSKLSLAQTYEVIQKIKQIKRNSKIEVETIKTRGDIKKIIPFYEFKKPGVFVKELNYAILEGRIDCAIHSMKDLPLNVDPDLKIVAIPKRSTPNDAFVSKGGNTFKGLGKNAKIGTGSIRRTALIQFHRPDLKVIPIRGNLDTRLTKLQTQDLDGIIVAEAGLRRLNYSHYITEVFSKSYFPPAPGQGALAVIIRRDIQDPKLLAILKKIEDPPSRKAIELERHILRALGGGCHLPIGVLAEVKQNTINVSCSIISPTVRKFVYVERTFDPSDYSEIITTMISIMVDKGANEILEELN